ncbi:MAG: hypothetical protein ACREEC_06000, partial [Thermoplasmata archaeon]
MAAVVPFTRSLGAKAVAIGEDIVDDPLAWMIRIFRLVGSAFLIVGFSMGTIAYYLKASATAAANNEINTLGGIGAIFSNIKPLTFQPAATGTAPITASLSGVQNFFADAWSDVQAIGGDVASIGGVIGTLAEDVGIAVTDVAKAILAFVMHFPDILWNGLVWGVGGAIADIFSWAFPYFILIGGILVIASFAIWGVRAAWRGIVGEGFGRAWEEKHEQLSIK